jgi:acetyl-CoA acetyltransferase
MKEREVVIISGARTAIGRLGGTLKDLFGPEKQDLFAYNSQIKAAMELDLFKDEIVPVLMPGYRKKSSYFFQD